MSGYGTIPPRTSEGVPYTKRTPGRPSFVLQAVGKLITCSADQDTQLIVSFSEDREIQGAAAIADGHDAYGDYAKMEILLPEESGDDPLGLLADKMYVPPDGKFPEVCSEGASFLPSGYRIRITYHATSTAGDRTFRVYLRTRV